MCTARDSNSLAALSAIVAFVLLFEEPALLTATIASKRQLRDYPSGGSRNWEGGGAPARVWQWVGRSSRRVRPGVGGTPPAQLGGVGERCKLPHRGLGLRPRSQRFLLRKPPQKYVKNVITD